MNKKIIFPLLALTIIIIGTVFLFTSNILTLNTPMIQELIESKTLMPEILVTKHNVNTECEFFTLLQNKSLLKNMIDDLTLDNPKYTKDLKETMVKYEDHFIRGNTFTDMSQIPPDLFDDIIAVIVNSNSINPELEPFVKKMMRGDITEGEMLQIIANEQSECGNLARNSMADSYEHALLKVEETKVMEPIKNESNIEPQCGVGTVFDPEVNTCVLG
jgi:hypothetical protein